MNTPLAAGQFRLATIGVARFRVRLVRPAPEKYPAWVCTVEMDGDGEAPGGLMFLIRSADIGELMPDAPDDGA